MAETLALLLHDRDQPLGALKPALESQAIHTCRGRNCRDARDWLGSKNPPQVVFTDIALPDGTWADVLSLAGNTNEPLNVIVVGRLMDVKFYAEVIQRGAFDFIAPPFVASDLAHLVRCANVNGSGQRQILRAVA